MKLFIITLPKPKNPPVCYISHFVSEIHETRGNKILVDGPARFSNYRERMWIPKNWASETPIGG